MNIRSWLALAVVAGLLYALGFVSGAGSERSKQQRLDEARLQQSFEQGQALGTVKEKVVVEYVDRVVKVYQAGATITKEVPIYVSKAADNACVVPAGFVRVHDAGAANLPMAAGPGVADDASSGLALSTVAASVVDNYSQCHANAEQLKALQQWVRESQALLQGAPAMR
ncbi:hypothetical protein [Pseudomonas protegens]|uniref:hypothetical protein n=1 Tax=Pseudomonas protegens TaxID=380021 RepID=UPI000F49B78A|nr:hypothetical protein [Pseudomonas protegens]ROL88723.1 hypothetical protein BK639_25170 [Pseudomonas protegens]ROM01072.1 hypothetical protein BK640_18570 [Pseudomonas protegens]ROM02367.1 hypothetical protein BK641_18030 [Pseudomonas protegens]ROM04741.1 hypothetical protein BK642_23935 [Pseudomonas protegens]